MVILIYLLHLSLDLMKVFVQLIFGQKQIPAVLWKVRHMIWKETICGFKQGKFPINLQAESQGELMDGAHIKVTTLIDTGCSKPILNKKFYDKHPYLHEMPHYSIQSIGVVVADDGVIKVTEAIQFMIKFHGHVFEFIAYLADMSDTFDFVIGQKSMYELEATVDYNNLAFTFLKRSLPIYAKGNYTIKPRKSKDIVLELKEIPFEVHGYKDFPKDEVATVAKLKSAKDSQMVQTLYITFREKWKNYCPIILLFQ